MPAIKKENNFLNIYTIIFVERLKFADPVFVIFLNTEFVKNCKYMYIKQIRTHTLERKFNG